MNLLDLHLAHGHYALEANLCLLGLILIAIGILLAWIAALRA